MSKFVLYFASFAIYFASDANCENW